MSTNIPTGALPHRTQAIIACLILLGAASHSSAQTFFFWNNPNGGNYGSAFNWSPGAQAPPKANDGAEFGLSATYTTAFTSDHAIGDVFVSAGNVSWDLGQNVNDQHTYTAHDVEVSSGAQLTFFDGRVVASAMRITSGGKVHVLGADQNDAAHITVTGAGSTLTHDNFLEIADQRPEMLTIENGGAVVSGTGSVGADSFFGSEGIVNVTGPGSSWTVDNSNIDVGDFSKGTLNILNGGTVKDRFGNIGFDGAGTVNVSGAGSTWNNTMGLFIGRGKTGTLNVTAGGLVKSVNGIVGTDTGSHAIAEVSGAGSKWLNDALLAIGDDSETNGHLTIRDGGFVSDAGAIIGNFGAFSTFSAAVGRVDVLGAGSTWSHNGNLTVGSQGIATLNVASGGVVANGIGQIAYAPNSKGDVTVTGANSKWTNTGVLHVGRQGDGTLTITDGGEVSSLFGHVGGTNAAQPDTGKGDVTVRGPGSKWTSTALHVGLWNTGTMTIENGGVVSSGNSFLATFAGSDGTATVTGAGSMWNNSDSLNIGSLGNGRLTIENGGSVTNVDGHVGPSSGSAGTVTVRGAGSTWNMTGDLFLGAQGSGSMTIENGGRVTSLSGNIARAGGTPYGTAAVLVKGAGSKWTTTNELRIGNNGVGTFAITDGGTVSNATAYIATTAGSTGVATVGGAGATWNVAGILHVAGDLNTSTNGGAGSLNINPGGTVTLHDAVVFPGGVVRLQGGTLDTSTVSFEGAGGQFQWTSGTLHVDIFEGNLANQGGTLSPGHSPAHSPGLTTIVGDYVQQSDGKLDIEIGGLNALGNDLVNVLGTAALGGQLQLSLINDFRPSANQTIPILESVNLSGAFANVANGQRIATADYHGSFRVNYGAGSTFNPNRVVLDNFLFIPLPGDFNANGAVDAADYTVWRDSVGSTKLLANDPYGGTIGTAQYEVWRNNFGHTLAATATALTNVPEPATASLLLLALLTCHPRRKQTRPSAPGSAGGNVH